MEVRRGRVLAIAEVASRGSLGQSRMKYCHRWIAASEMDLCWEEAVRRLTLWRGGKLDLGSYL